MLFLFADSAASSQRLRASGSSSKSKGTATAISFFTGSPYRTGRVTFY
jgi:hypothetical protein